jgi:O-antigen ligase
MIKFFNLNNNSILFFKLIFFLFPFFLISGPLLPDLLTVLVSIYFIIYCFLNKEIFFFKKNLVIYFLVFYLYVNINSFFGHLPLVSFSNSLPYIRMIFFSIFFAYLLTKIVNLKKIIFFSFLLSYLILFFDSLIQIKTGYNILGYPIVTERIASLFRDKLVMGSYVSRTLPILIAISYFENFKHANFLRTLCICLAGTLVFFSAERLSLFFFIITVFLYLSILPKKKIFLINAGLLVSLFFVLIFFKPSSIDRLYKHTLNQFNDKNFYWFSERHEMQFVTAYRMFLDKKFFGHGINSFRYLCDKEPYSTRDLIKSNNKKFSPINGYYYLKKNFVDGKTFAFFIEETKMLEFEKISQALEDSIISKNNFLTLEANKNLELFKKNNLLIAWQIHHVVLDPIKSGSLVKKGDYIFSNSEFANGCNTHPHNLHLQVLSELGLFGYFFLFTFFFYLILIFFKNFINIVFKKYKNKKYNNNLYCIFIVVGLIQFLFPIVPSGNIFNNWLSIFFYFKLAFLFNILYYNK